MKFGKRLGTSLVDELDTRDSEGVDATLGAADARSDDDAGFFSLPFDPWLDPTCRERCPRDTAEPTSLSPFIASLDFDLLVA